jgi:hypothetical protein
MCYPWLCEILVVSCCTGVFVVPALAGFFLIVMRTAQQKCRIIIQLPFKWMASRTALLSVISPTSTKSSSRGIDQRSFHVQDALKSGMKLFPAYQIQRETASSPQRPRTGAKTPRIHSGHGQINIRGFRKNARAPEQTPIG